MKWGNLLQSSSCRDWRNLGDVCPDLPLVSRISSSSSPPFPPPVCSWSWPPPCGRRDIFFFLRAMPIGLLGTTPLPRPIITGGCCTRRSGLVPPRGIPSKSFDAPLAERNCAAFRASSLALARRSNASPIGELGMFKTPLPSTLAKPLPLAGDGSVFM